MSETGQAGRRYKHVNALASAVATTIDLAGMSAELRRALLAAALRLDVEATRQIIAQVREFDPAAAAQLEAWVNEYRYDRILALCDDGERDQTAD